LKHAQDQRIAFEPIEKSSRFVFFGQKVGGKYQYYTPGPDLERLGLYRHYQYVMDLLFDAYVALVPRLCAWLKGRYAEKESVLEKKAFDTLRGLLPMATLGQVAFRGNAQAFEYFINRTAAHPLGEFRWIAQALKTELDEEIPSLLLRLSEEKSKQYQRYLSGRIPGVREHLRAMSKDGIYPYNENLAAAQARVTLEDYDRDGEERVLTGILYVADHKSWRACREEARHLSQEERCGVFEKYLNGRTARWQKVGRAFENASLRYEILMDIGAYRDLQRHRMLTQERQLFTVRHGYEVPRDVIDAGLEADYRAALDSVVLLFDELERESPELAQYVVPMAYQVRFYQNVNLRECFWEMELRTGPQGHPNYRAIEQKKFRLLQAVYPMIASFMLVDMNDYPFARRGTDEAIALREARTLEGLQKKQ